MKICKLSIAEAILRHKASRMLFIVTVELTILLNYKINCNRFQIDSSEANSRLSNQEIAACYKSRMSIAVSIKVRQWFVFWTKCILLTTACTLSLKFFPLCLFGPTRATAFTFSRFLDHTQRRTTVGRTPQDEWSARRKRLLYGKTQNSQRTDIHAPGRIWILNLRKASGRRPTP
jgi:hypothetical protein